MPCTTCLSNCDPLISDKCVKYTGPAIPILGICSGDSLFEVEAIILAKLQTALDGTGIELADVDLECTYFETLFNGQDKTITNLVQTLITGECNLDGRITALAAQIGAPFSFNTACLTGTLTTRDYILQAVILKACDVDARLAVVESLYIKQSDLCAQVTACIASGISTQFNSRMVPYTYIPYAGPLSNFDNTGKGLFSSGFDKIYLANGLNGTKDFRGRSPIGAIQNVPGGILDAAVDPSLPANTAYNYTLGTKYGVSNQIITILQIPAHTHALIQNTHSHTFNASVFVGAGNGTYGANSNGSSFRPATSPTSSTLVTISASNAGGGQSLNNVQPSIATLFITYIP